MRMEKKAEDVKERTHLIQGGEKPKDQSVRWM
jgi:hypothetical protein